MNEKIQKCNSKKTCDVNEHMSSCKKTGKEIIMYFYKCDICGQIVASTEELINPLSCCNHEMRLLTPAESDGALEKHVPVYSIEGETLTVSIGSEPHPMVPEHYIEWVCLVTCCGVQWQPLEPGIAPVATFKVKPGEQVVAIYEYCNIHGLYIYSSED